MVVNTHMQSRNPNDAVAELSVATNARLALIGGGAYLKDRLDANTAAPADIVDAVNSFANTIEQLGINYLVGADPMLRIRYVKTWIPRSPKSTSCAPDTPRLTPAPATT